jgi:hypothetical protein
MVTQFCYDLGFVVVAFSISHKVPHLQISFYLKLGLTYSKCVNYMAVFLHYITVHKMKRM